MSSPPSHPNGTRAVLIGVSSYQDHALPDLPAAEEDLRGLSAALTDEVRGVFSREDCTVLHNPDARSFGQVISRACREPADVLLIYYTGHGLLDDRDNLHFGLAGSDRAQIPWTALPFETVRDALASSSAAVKILLLDCSYSGLAADVTGWATAMGSRQIDAGVTYIMTSTDSAEAAYIDAEQRYSAFTGALLTVVESERDRDLTLEDLYAGINRLLVAGGAPPPAYTWLGRGMDPRASTLFRAWRPRAVHGASASRAQREAMPVYRKGGSRAVLIGAAHFDDPDLDDIPAVVQNVRDLAEVVTSSAGGGFDAENCTVVTDPVDDAQIHEAVQEAAASATDVLLVYYAGHGLLDRQLKLYFTTAKSRSRTPRLRSLGYDRLREELEDSPARVRILILDCCFSGSALPEGFVFQSDVASAVRAQLDLRGGYVLTSSDRNEPSVAPAGHRNTAFTAALLIAANSPGLTLQEVYEESERILVANSFPRPRGAGTAGRAKIFGKGSQIAQLRRAADFGDVKAMRNLSIELEATSDLDGATRWWRRATGLSGSALADLIGDDSGNYYLHLTADVSMRGPDLMRLGTLREKRGDLIAAEVWYKRAISAAVPAAAAKLALLTIDMVERAITSPDGMGLDIRGRSTSRSPREIQDHFQEQAERGDPRAMVALANSLGPPRLLGSPSAGERWTEAEQWYMRAAQAGSTVAMYLLGDEYRFRGKPELGRAWLDRAAEAGSPFAMESLGQECAEIGDLAQADRWIRRAMAHGGLHLGLKLSLWRDEEWMRAAAASCDSLAMCNLGLKLRRRDQSFPEEAKMWFRRAAEDGNPLGILFLCSVLAGQLGGAIESLALAEAAGQTVEEIEKWYRFAYEQGAMNVLRELDFIPLRAVPFDCMIGGSQSWYDKCSLPQEVWEQSPPAELS
ncbi:caspase family protein [Nocardia sp. NPDC005825]|uniref:caspase, EACC1-associated type n=1 Tax=unclassified Nocardia TaxID=2637762 RepID=UPI0034066670